MSLFNIQKMKLINISKLIVLIFSISIFIYLLNCISSYFKLSSDIKNNESKLVNVDMYHSNYDQIIDKLKKQSITEQQAKNEIIDLIGQNENYKDILNQENDFKMINDLLADRIIDLYQQIHQKKIDLSNKKDFLKKQLIVLSLIFFILIFILVKLELSYPFFVMKLKSDNISK